MRDFSEKLGVMMESPLGRAEAAFPQPKRLKAEIRTLLSTPVRNYGDVCQHKWGSSLSCGGPPARLRSGGVRRRRSARRCPTWHMIEYVTVFVKPCTKQAAKLPFMD